jgi:cyclase
MPRMSESQPWVREVSDGIYAYIQPDGTWFINNTGFLVMPGGEGVVSVDACSTERRTLALREAIARVTAAPVRTLVNTHFHGDHTNGNVFFPGATIVAHERTRLEVLTGPPLEVYERFFEVPEWGAVRRVAPFLTYTDQVAVYAGELRCEIRYVGQPAHTGADSIVWIPERRVLFAGDLVFHGGTPFVLMGSVAGTIAVSEDLKRLGAETVVPGHGDVCGPEWFDQTIGYLAFVQQVARRGIEAGLTPLEAARDADLGGYKAWTDAERIVGNLHRAYAELGGLNGSGAGAYAVVDVLAALQEMVAFNGGPLHCHA